MQWVLFLSSDKNLQEHHGLMCLVRGILLMHIPLEWLLLDPDEDYYSKLSYAHIHQLRYRKIDFICKEFSQIWRQRDEIVAFEVNMERCQKEKVKEIGFSLFKKYRVMCVYSIKLASIDSRDALAPNGDMPFLGSMLTQIWARWMLGNLVTIGQLSGKR